MQERPQNFNAGADESEATLVAPRFDADDARRAHPVVPLSESRTRAPFADARATARRGPRRSWTPALVAIVLLGVAAMGGAVATQVLRRTPAPPAAAQAPAEAAPNGTSEAAAEPLNSAAAPREQERPRPSARTTRARRAEAAAVSAPAETARADVHDFGGDDEGRRERAKERRRERRDDERRDNEGEKEMRKVLKRAKEKAPRLFDVLVTPNP